MRQYKKHIDYSNLRTPERIEKLRKVLEKRQKTLSVIMENVHDPHNLSAAVRSCDAVGILSIDLLYHNGQEKPKLGRQSSASAKKWVNRTYHTTVDDCFNKVRSEGKKIYTTHLSEDAVSIYDIDLTEPVALLFGNEHTGVTEEALSKADGNVIIPQVGVIQSLNISVAVAVSVYEAFRQRLKKGMYEHPEFDENEFNVLLNEWLSR